ncbi:MAG: rhodanese-like domain-containing protein [Holophagaceae bacterium]|nr:rhodanese-like domain-containing protein [Holophagaceae bacterium]
MPEVIHLEPEAFRDLPPEAQVVDVREEWEWALGHLPRAVHIPLGQLMARCDELDPGRPVALYCHHGVRSLHGLAFLRHHGFENVVHLSGGTEAWRRVDPAFPAY